MTSGEGLDLPFRLLCVPCDPTVPPGLIFRRVLDVILDQNVLKLVLILYVCFGVSLERGCGTFLGVFEVTSWCQNDDQEEMGRFVEMVVLCKEIYVFKGCGLHLGCQEERKRKVGIDLA